MTIALDDALASLYRTAADDDTLVCGHSRYAIAPRAIADTASRVRRGNRTEPRTPAVESVIPLIALQDLDVVVLRLPGTAAESDSEWASALARLRFGLSESLLAHAVRHLDERTLLQHQMVQGTLADVAIDHAELGSVLTGPAAPGLAVLDDMHGRITRTDRTLMRLFGAYGFTAAGPGRTAYFSQLLADVYIGRTT